MPLGTHGVEGLQQQGPQQLLRYDAGAADAGLQSVELRRQHVQGLAHHGPDQPQRMIRRYPRLAAHVAEQRTRLLVQSPHQPAPPHKKSESRQLCSRPEFFSSLLEQVIIATKAQTRLGVIAKLNVWLDMQAENTGTVMDLPRAAIAEAKAMLGEVD